MLCTLKNELLAHQNTFANFDENLLSEIINCAEICKNALENGKKILIFGNGGSAADAQHFAAELSARYKKERKGLAAISLATDTSALTAIGNDYGFDYVFSRQINALANEGDIAIGISTSGTSKNVLFGLSEAKNCGCKGIMLASKKANEAKISSFLMENSGTKATFGEEITLLDYLKARNITPLLMPSNDTPRIQEAHIFTIHSLCQLIEKDY